MSTSDDTSSSNPSESGAPADDQRIDRLYRASHDAKSRDADSTSPADLDDLIRAAARSTQSPGQSSSWNWQQRFGWATATAVVLTSALFITLPDTVSELSYENRSERSSQAEVPAPTQPGEVLSDAMAPEASLAKQPSMADQMPRQISGQSLKQAPALAKKTEQNLAGADSERRIGLARRGLREIDPATVDSSHMRQTDLRFEELVVSDTPTGSSCVLVGDGLIERICSVPGNPSSYILHPKEASACNKLTLDKQRSRPEPDAASNSDQFVYSEGERKFSASCQQGDWVVQSLARGR